MAQAAAGAGTLQAALTSFQSIFSWTPFSIDRVTSTSAQQIKLPDLLAALPDAARDFRINSLCKEISESSDRWASEFIASSSLHVRNSQTAHISHSNTKGDEENVTLDLTTGLLASMCFPTADRTQLRLCADFLAWIWLLDHHLTSYNHETLIECIEEAVRLVENEPAYTEISQPGFSKALQDILKRLERSPESKYVYDRFRRAVLDYLQLLHSQLSRSPNAYCPRNLKDYLARHREAGWHTPLFMLIEYAYGLESISVEKQTQAVVKLSRGIAAEIIVYAIDIYACAGAFARSGLSTPFFPNCVMLLAQEQQIDIPKAVEQAGLLCVAGLRTFHAYQVSLLREGAKVTSASANAETKIYVRGLGDCIRGLLHWAFESERFFGQDGAYVRMTLTIEPSSSASNMQDETAGE